MDATTISDGEQEERNKRQALMVVPQPLAEERLETWRKMVIAALGLAWPRRFATLAVPERFVEQLGAEFARIGFGTRVSAVGRPAEVRTLAIWEPSTTTPGERMRAEHGRALHRNGLVIEDGYRQGIELTDEDVREGAWFG